MAGSEPTTNLLRNRLAFAIGALSLVAVAVVTLWDYQSGPSDAPEMTPLKAPVTVSTERLDALFTAMGMSRPQHPSEAPDFTLMNLEGRPVRLREFRGKLVLLNFWATWCAPCEHEMPSMERLYQAFKTTNFVLLAVSMDRQGAEVAPPFIKRLQLTFPILLDSTFDVSHQFAVRGLPTTYLIDVDGLLIGAAIGARDWYRTEAKLLIATLLRQAEASTEHAQPGHP